MSKSFFVSDIHFGLQSVQEENIKLERFERLSGIVTKDGGSLYMVGDILAYWMEFRHVIPKHFDGFLCLLKDLVRQGIEVHYYAGNHDFYLGDFFSKTLGVHAWYGMHEMLIDGKTLIQVTGSRISRCAFTLSVKPILRLAVTDIVTNEIYSL